MSKRVMDLTTRYNNFRTKQGLVKFLLDNDYELILDDLNHIFKYTGKSLNPHHNNLDKAISYLLKTLKDEQLSALIKLLNNDFSFDYKYIFDLSSMEDKFDCYTFQCNNKATEKVLIELAKKLKLKEKNANLEEFKKTLN